MRIHHRAVLLALVGLSCSCPQPAPTQPAQTAAQAAPASAPPAAAPATDRTPAVAADHPLYKRVEGDGFQNGCAADGECHVGGCSTEVCTAEEGVSSTCDLPADGWPTVGAKCGCVAGQCQWWKPAASGPAPATAVSDRPCDPAGGCDAGKQGRPCDVAGRCDAGLRCIAWFGVAGPRGPRFTSCDIPCDGSGTGCPAGQRCITIADGPGRVCRP